MNLTAQIFKTCAEQKHAQNRKINDVRKKYLQYITMITITMVTTTMTVIFDLQRDLTTQLKKRLTIQ